MQPSVEDAKVGKLDSVLCYKLDRVGRSLLNVVDAHDRLQTLGVGLRSAKEQVETTTPAGRLQFQMLAGFAEFERGTIRERTQDGLHRALRAGKQPGRVPYGYRIGDGGRFEVVEDEARVLTQIFTNIAGGSTIYREVRRLNDEGIPAPGYRVSGKARVPGKRWNTATVSVMLGYPVLPWIGIMLTGYVFGQLYLPTYEADKRRKILIYLALGAIALFILLRFINIYGDPHLVRPGGYVPKYSTGIYRDKESGQIIGKGR